MKSGVTVTIDKTQEIAKALQRLAESRVLVGIPSEKNARTDEGQASPITNAALGYIHETGMPEQNIPARPFLLPGVKGSSKAWLPYLRAAGIAAMSGDGSGVDKNLKAAGLTAQNAVRAHVISGEGFAPLAPATLASRQRKGRSGTKPLIDTSQMLKAITYVIRRGK